ncbi:MAG: hypothetical protein AABW83_03815 [Nanoarchaeota archaeon]
MANINPPQDLTSWAFLRDSLNITYNGAKCGYFKLDDHYENTSKFNICLKRLRERRNLDFDPDIFSLYINGISYVDIQTRIFKFSQKNNIEYNLLLNNLIEDTDKILGRKTINYSILKEIIDYLR